MEFYTEHHLEFELICIQVEVRIFYSGDALWHQRFRLRIMLLCSVPDMTYNVFSGTLNHNQSQLSLCASANFSQPAAEIGWRVWGPTPQQISTGFASWQRYCTAVGVSKLCGVEQRAPPILGRAAITLGIGPHSSCLYLSAYVYTVNSTNELHAAV